jgi:hypothetical protein
MHASELSGDKKVAALSGLLDSFLCVFAQIFDDAAGTVSGFACQAHVAAMQNQPVMCIQ